MTLPEALANLDDYGAWLAAVAAGLGALVWLLTKAWKLSRTAYQRAVELGRKVDALDEIARRELTEGEYGERSTKDYARIAAGHALAIEKLEEAVKANAARLDRLEAWRDELVDQDG